MKSRAILIPAVLGALALLNAFHATPASASPLDLTVVSAPPAGSVLVADESRALAGGPVALSGTATHDAAVTVSTGAPATALCATVALADGSWSCPIVSAPDLVGPVAVSSGGEVVLLDFSVLGPPTLPTDPPGTLTSTVTADDLTQPVAGAGAPGALVTVTISDIDGAGSGCSALVTAGSSWSCTVPAPPPGAGPYSVAVSQAYPWAAGVVVEGDGAEYAYEAPGVVGPGTGSGDGSGDGSGGGGGDGGGDGGGGGDGPPGAENPSIAPGPEVAASAPPTDPSAVVIPVAVPDDPVPSAFGDERPLFADGPPPVDRSVLDPSIGPSPLPPESALARPTTPAAPLSAASGDVRNEATEASFPGAGPVGVPVSAFSGSLRTVGEALAIGVPGAVRLGLLVVGMLLLVMVPGGILESTVSDNWTRITRAWPVTWFSAVRERRLPSPASSWVWAAATIAVGALASVFVAPASSPAAWPELAALIVPLAVALVVANAVPLGATSGYAWARLRRRAQLLVRPSTLLLTAATVLLSRLAGLEPGFVFGASIGLVFGIALERASGARAVVVGALAALLLGVGSWTAASALRASPGAGAGDALLLDTLTAITVCALSAPVVALLPLSFLDGQALFRASRPAWAALYSVSLATFGVVLVPLADAWSPVVSDLAWWLACLAAVSALTAAVWLYFRYVPDPRRPASQPTTTTGSPPLDDVRAPRPDAPTSR
ncbi:hypothetical protein [Herbiconiux flava]|uniref:Bacterial Ig-like domain-containing protein n=1 Tax=Herbiconiux flava TaxID=881268 RepID=A0A852SKS5_9MICO|nr:hypothetical protein [Herbiconiux flava]NYD69071.1 hypothetical protein [Herbiconiux flava]GLK15819.1 hypothetical protein GCM10017602_03010 [Herbiconiux flava]